MTGTPTILLVEDNHEHLKLTRYILKRQKVHGDLHIVRDGQEALDYLYRRGDFADTKISPRPDLVLLDLNIPRIAGREVLRIIKTDESLKSIPVVVVSSSNREEDVSYAFEHGAAAYISKAEGFEKLNEALSSIHTFAIPAGRDRRDEKP